MMIGAGKVLEEEDATKLLGHWKGNFIRECGAAVIGEDWRAILEGDAAAGDRGGGKLSIIEYARASKGECEDFHSLAWKRPVSRQSYHALCFFEEAVAGGVGGGGGGVQKVPYRSHQAICQALVCCRRRGTAGSAGRRGGAVPAWEDL